MKSIRLWKLLRRRKSAQPAPLDDFELPTLAAVGTVARPPQQHPAGAVIGERVLRLADTIAQKIIAAGKGDDFLGRLQAHLENSSQPLSLDHFLDAQPDGEPIRPPLTIQGLPSHDPRAVADELLKICAFPERVVPTHIKARLRVEVLFLQRFMDMAFGKREGNPAIDLNPKPRARMVPCETCKGSGQGIEAYSNGAGAHCERTINCPDCDGEAFVEAKA